MKTTRLNVNLSAKMKQELEAVCRELNVPMTAFVIMALSDYLKQREAVDAMAVLRHLQVSQIIQDTRPPGARPLGGPRPPAGTPREGKE